MQEIIIKKTMGKNLINVALFGLGRIGLMHANNLINNKNFNLKYIFDVNRKLAKKVSKNLNCQNIESPQIAYKDKKIDCIFISSTTSTHLKFIYESIKSNKTVFCEKPLALDLDEIASIQELSIKQKLNLHIGFNRRFDPDFQKLKKNIDDGVVGDIYQITITSRDPSPPSIDYIKESGGLFLDMTIHDFDMIRYLTNAEVDEIYVKGKCMVDPNIGKAGDIDTAIINTKLTNSVIASIINSRKAVYGYDQRIEILGSKGSLQVGNQLLHGINKGTERADLISSIKLKKIHEKILKSQKVLLLSSKKLTTSTIHLL